MEKVNEIRMTLIILLVGTFFLSGCFFDKKYEVTFKTNGGSEVKSVTLKSGAKLKDIDEPKKDGYKFIGWYVKGKEFDLNSEITEDITLVAKWEKIEIEYEDEEIEDNFTTTTTSSTSKRTTKYKTTKLKSTSKKSTTRKSTTTKKPTTTTVKPTTESTTKEVITISTTASTTTSTTTTSTSTTSTSTSTTSTSTTSTSSLIPEETTTTVVTTEVVKMKVERVEEKVKNEETEEEVVINNIKITFDVEDNESNVESNILFDDYLLFKDSNIKEWNVSNEYGYNYQDIYNVEAEDVNEINLNGSSDLVNSLIIFDGVNRYLLEYNDEIDKWMINYPVVSISNELVTNYYSDFNYSLTKINDGDTLTLLKDINLENTIDINKFITIDFNNKIISHELEYIFNIKELNNIDKDIIFKNINMDVVNFINVEENNILNKILILDSNIRYSNLFKNDVDVTISLVNTSLSGIL